LNAPEGVGDRDAGVHLCGGGVDAVAAVGGWFPVAVGGLDDRKVRTGPDGLSDREGGVLGEDVGPEFLGQVGALSQGGAAACEAGSRVSFRSSQPKMAQPVPSEVVRNCVHMIAPMPDTSPVRLRGVSVS
jgi:hypothetical protein